MASAKLPGKADHTLALKKIKQLTTDLGIYQFGKGKVPDPSFGYALEDQARALIVTHQFGEKKLDEIYLDFIAKSYRKDGLFNQYFYEDSRGFVEDPTLITVEDKEEVYGTILWSLLSTNNYSKETKLLIEQLKKLVQNFDYPRAIATSLLGLTSERKASNLENQLTERLLEYFRKTASPNWQWFENYLTYANPILPWACWEVSINRNNSEAKKIAEESTNFLIEQCQIKGIPAPIGNQSWYKKGGGKAVFDQQPIDAAYMVCCLEKAYLVTQNPFYLEWAKKWWGWFWGNNLLKIPLVDRNFACYDGLTPTGVNLNQGAESNICFLLAFLAAKRMSL